MWCRHEYLLGAKPRLLDLGQGRGEGFRRTVCSITDSCPKGVAVSEQDDQDAPVPAMQRLLDNPFLLLFLGVLIPTVVYILWGVIDILTIPLAQ